MNLTATIQDRVDWTTLCCGCGFVPKSLKSFSKHLAMQHRTTLHGFLLEHHPSILSCRKCLGTIKANTNWTYRNVCSSSCARTGRVQSDEHVRKRLAATDQKAKEATKRRNLLKKSGGRYSNVSQLPATRRKMAASQLGMIRPRTAAHAQKIARSRRINGTHLHSAGTKRKISAGLRKTLGHKDFDRSVFVSVGRTRHRQGRYRGMFYRSSYELEFLRACYAHGIRVVSAENKEWGVNYRQEGQWKTYYPDFWLPDRKRLIEIKPEAMIPFNRRKIRAAVNKYGDTYCVVSETQLQKFISTGRIYR